MSVKINEVLLVLSLLCGCALAQVPKWAENNNHKKYPVSEYLLGVGIADNKTDAVERARADVAKQIQVKIESELETMEQEISSGDRSTIHAEVTFKTKSVVSETITGIEIVESVNVKGKYYALAVLNKQNYISGLEQEMDNILAESSQYNQSAREMVSRGSIFNALDNFISAKNTIPDFYIKRGLYTALTGRHYGSKNTESVASILSEIRTILAGINIKIINGDNQSSGLGKTLPSPIVAKVYYLDEHQNEVGLKWYPVITKYDNGETIAKIGSADDGTLSINVIATPTGSSASTGSVLFTLGLSNLPDIFRDDVSKIQTSASYSIKTAGLVFITEIKDINGLTSPALEKIVDSWVTKNGYRIDPAAALVIQGTTAINNEKTVDSPAGKQYFIDLGLDLILFDKKSSSQLSSVSGNGRGMVLGSREKAIQKAYENISVTKSKFAAFLQAAIQP